MTAVPDSLAALRDRPRESALFLDYDGTLAPIVDDPAGARPVPGVGALLADLGARLGRVAIVSGRPASFLASALGRPPGVVLAGLYGMEEIEGRRGVRLAPGVERWRPVVAEVTRAAAEAVPPGAEVEAKGLSVTLHWRRAPAAAAWAVAFAARAAQASGLNAQPGRMSIELRPPLDTDKGTVVRRLAAGYRVVACFGDDLGDLPAFAALDELARAGVVVTRVAVADAESPPEVVAAADVVVAGPDAAVGLLRAIAAG